VNDEPRCRQSEAEARFLAATLAELAEGERRGIDVLRVCRSHDAFRRYRPFFERQSDDEARHHAAFASLLPALPPPSPLDPLVDRFFARLEEVAATPAAIVAMHGVLETMAQGFLAGLARFWPGDALPFTRVARDEARHAAFGRRWMLRSGPLAREDAAIADLVRSLAAAFGTDSGYARLSPARRREYDGTVEGELGAAAARLAPLLSGLGLSRSARALEGIASP
jgi:hypothetical protein